MRKFGGARAIVWAPVIALLAVLPVHTAQADREAVCAYVPVGVFADVAGDSTHAANIDCAAAYGLTVGVGGGNYDPGGRVSRGQMASFLVNFFEVAVDTPAAVPSGAGGFEDVGGTTHETNIRVAASLGITRGRTPTRFDPVADVTRAQMASFVWQTMLAVGMPPVDEPLDAFIDDDGSTHEESIDALASLGVVRGVADGTYEPDGYVSRAQMATFLANAAGILLGADAWDAPALPVDGPEVVVVLPVAGADGSIVVRWDRAVSTDATGAEFTVRDEADGSLVATATDVAHAGDQTTLELDEALQPDEMYWLHIEGAAVSDAQGRPNAELSVAFVLSVSEPIGDEPGGGDDPGAGDEDVAPAPVIDSATTDPVDDAIVVTFDRAVVCPGTPDGIGAWALVNGVIEEPERAGGEPDAVEQPDPPSTTCRLVYDQAGIGDDDFGTLVYTQPTTTDDRVHTSDGGHLDTVNVDVVDTVAPTFTRVQASVGSAGLLLSFSESIACSTAANSQFLVTVNDVASTVDDYGCMNPAAASVAISLTENVQSGERVEVTIRSDTHLSDRSLDNQVVPATQVVDLP